MNESNVSHEEIKVRLSICCEFLLDEKKPIEEAYECLMNKLGRKLMEFSEFEYWFKRFENNQFDLGHDTSLDVKEKTIEADQAPSISKKEPKTEQLAVIPNKVEQQSEEVENVPKESIERKQLDAEKDAAISNEIAANVDTVEIVPIQNDHIKKDIQINIQNVPLIFQNLVRAAKEGFDRIYLHNAFCTFIMEVDKIQIRFEKKRDEWAIDYNKAETVTFATTDPVKLIVDHLLFVLQNQNWKINEFAINNFPGLIDFGRVLLRTLASFDHPLSVGSFKFERLNEDLFISLLKRLDPNSLKEISFYIYWKKGGDYRKMEEIFDLVQWKQAKTIKSLGDSPLTIDDLLHYENILWACDVITPGDVIRVRNRFLGSSSIESCTLRTAFEERMNVDEVKKALESEYLHSKITGNDSYHGTYFYRHLFENSFLKVVFQRNEVIFTKVTECS